MKKTSSLVLSVLLLLTLCVAAVAEVNPNQMGDPGGARVAEIIAQNQINQGQTGGYYIIPAAPTQDITTLPAEIPGETGGAIILPDNETPEQPNATDATGSASTSNNASSSTSGGAQSLDWYNGGKELFEANKSISVYDINTGISWSARYINGSNHADVVPASQADADKIESNKITGSYVRRPVIVTVGGVKYAGSMYAVGHGSTNYVKHFKGVMCIHFTGSQTHGSKKVDTDHQNAIQEALKYGN